MKILDAIRQQYAKAVEAVEGGDGSTPAEALYYDHIGYLIDLLTPKSPDEPPEEYVLVLIQYGKIRTIGYCCGDYWKGEANRDKPSGYELEDVRAWWELPLGAEEPK